MNRWNQATPECSAAQLLCRELIQAQTQVVQLRLRRSVQISRKAVRWSDNGSGVQSGLRREIYASPTLIVAHFIVVSSKYLMNAKRPVDGVWGASGPARKAEVKARKSRFAQAGP